MTNPDSKTTHQMYNVRNMYGLMMAQSTHKIISDKALPIGDRRPLVYSQSTFSAASGSVSAHIAAPVARSWDWLRYSVASVLNMNILGVPMSGVDVCGTTGTQDAQLCAYWYQLAVFQPIARNHYLTTDKNPANEPYLVTDAPSAALIRTAMYDRLRVMRYMYTEFFKVTLKGGAFVKPMFFNFPADPDALRDVEQDFMVGEYVKVSPLLTKPAGATPSYSSYFPTAKGEAWVNLFNLSDLQSTVPDAADAKEADKKFQRNSINAGDHVNAYLMPGAIIPMQGLTYQTVDPTTKKTVTKTAKTSNEMMQQIPVDLVLNMNANEEARGDIFVDDGYSQDMLEAKQYDFYSFYYSAGNLRKEWSNNSQSAGLPDSVTQMNRYVNSVTFVNSKGKTFDFYCWANQLQQVEQLTPTTSTDGTYTTFTFAQPVNLFSISGIYIGDKSKHKDLCTIAQKKWIAAAVPVLKDMPTASISLASSDATDKTVYTVNIKLIEKKTPEQLQDIMVSITTDGVTPFVPTEVLTDYATKFATVGDLSKRLVVTQGMVNPDKSITPFSFQILSDSDHTTVIWDSANHPLLLSQYLMLWGGSMKTGQKEKFVPAFGLGERVDDFWLSDGIYSFWNRNMASQKETEMLPAKNGYGTHPYIAWKTPADTFAAKFVLNVAANDVMLSSDKTAGSISFDQISVGGSMQLFVQEARNPEKLVQQYHKLVGNPELPP